MSNTTKRVDRGRGHSYLLDGEKVPGVTTIIGKGLPKPALTTWAANTAAAHAVDHWEELGGLAVSERLDRIKKAPWADRDAAAGKGTAVHGLAERLIHGEAVEVPEELAGHVEACVAFLDISGADPIVVERPVFNRRWKYGGTLDLIATLADGQTWLLDWKTNRSGPYGDVALQLAAYARAEFYINENGEEQPLPHIDRAGVVWLRSDGFELYPFRIDEQVWRSFLYVKSVADFAEWSRDCKEDAVDLSGWQEAS